ncbi:hypothetical protein, partial [Rhodovulum viride]
AAMVEEANAAAVTMKQEAGNLQSLVARFRLKTQTGGGVRPRETTPLAFAPAPAADLTPRRIANGGDWKDF